MSQQDFLVELGTEELPPTALKRLAQSFADGIKKNLTQSKLEFGQVTWYAAPRRLAVKIEALQTAQQDREIERRGPALKAAYDKDGNPSKAGEGFARSCGVSMEELDKIETEKGAWLVYRSIEKGQQATALLPGFVDDSLAKLPIPKRMRWGSSRIEFVRPVHWLVMLLGNDVVDCEILGLTAGRETFGHRFHHNQSISLQNPSEYLSKLKDGYVIADFADRQEQVRQQVLAEADKLGGQAVIDEELLEEVTALNEWPVALTGRFEDRFLDVPPEALILTMKINQKYFHIVDNNDKLLPNFITISNIESKDPQQVIQGNERVVRPRLADAAFFFETDKKKPLADRIEPLKSIVFQTKLGTVFDKTQRVKLIAAKIADLINGDVNFANRAANLSKTDLVSEMVLEFDKLQGLMGQYYAIHDGEPEEVAAALNEQYWPKFSGDKLPETKTGCALALADRIDTLVGLFGINQPPTGDKDPFALRRAALGVLRIIVDKELDLDLKELLQYAAQNLGSIIENKNTVDDVFNFMLDRFRAWYAEKGISAEVFLAVRARTPTSPMDFDQRVKAVNSFVKLPEAQALAAANKRVANILAKSTTVVGDAVDNALLEEDAEKQLATMVADKAPQVKDLFEARNYNQALASLADMRDTIDLFFDQVMVMAENEAIKNNRIALLNQLRNLFLSVADISLLPSS